MAQVAVNASPFSCRWIQRGSEMRISNWSYAVCLRLRESRVVNETECARCARWEAPDGREAIGRLFTMER